MSAPGQPESPEPVTPMRLSASRWAWRGAAVVALVTVVSRSLWLDRPSVLVFDEVFYASDAVDLLARGVEGGTPVHPPVGKWMIALGVRIIGFDPWGWRIAALLTGGLVAALTWLLAWRITRSGQAAVLASSFVMFDGISVVTGRLALLDGFVALWIIVAVSVLVLLVQHPLDCTVQRRWRWWLGIALGLGVATKWSAAVLIPIAMVALLFVDTRLPTAGLRRRALAHLGLAVVALPVGIYVLAHAGWFLNFDDTAAGRKACDTTGCDHGWDDRAVAFVNYQLDVWDFHRHLEPTSSEVASSLTWVVQTHPAGLFVKSCSPELATQPSVDSVCTSGGTEARVLAVGNPAVWVFGSASVVAATVVGVRRRDPVRLVLVSVALALWVPWWVGGRPAYSFYAAPLVPLLATLAGVTWQDLPRRALRFWPVPVALVVAVGAALWPLWTAAPLSSSVAERLLLFEGWR